QMLTMARLAPEATLEEPAALDLDRLAASVVAEFEPLAEAKAIELRLGRVEPARAIGQEQALHTLAGNLVDNAIRYTPPGGHVSVRRLLRAPQGYSGPMATRRAFMAGALAVVAAPLVAQEKKAGRVYRVGVLESVSLSDNAANIDEFRKGLRELGYVEGQNLLIEYRSAEGRVGRYPNLAAELSGLNVDLIVARGTPATLAAKNAHGKIPVVTAPVADPVETGLVASLARPGGNVTGLAMLVSELETKRVDLLRALAPRTKRIAALMNMGNPAFASVWKAIDEAARSMGLQALLVDVRRFAQVAPALQSAKAQAADALVVRLGP